MNISAVIPTYGGYDISPVLDSIPYDDIIVWDCKEREQDLGLYGRYEAIKEAKHDIIYTQDDDLLFSRFDRLEACYTPGRAVFNSDPKKDIAWCARGALFHRDLPFESFKVYLEHYPFDELFTHNGCDMTFALLGPVDRVWFGSVDLDYAEAPGRVSTRPGWWGGKRDEMQRRCMALRGDG